VDDAGAAGEAGAVADVFEAEAGVEGGRVFGVEAATVVADADAELFGVPGEADVDVCGRGVFKAILETLLDDAEEDELFFFLYLLFAAFGGDRDGEAAGLADAGDFFVDGFADAEVADVAGVEALGETAEILQCARDVGADFLYEGVVGGFVFLEAA